MLSATRTAVLLLLLFASTPAVIYSQASCSGAYDLTSSISLSCTTVTGDLEGATNAAPTGACGGATATTTNGVWYKFTATSANATITVNGLGSNLSTTTTYLEVLNGTCPSSFTSLACQNVSSSLSLTTLAVNTVYYVRVYVTGSTTSGGNPNRRGFTICIQSLPNDECSSAITLSNGTTNNTGSVWTATASSVNPAGCATGNPDDDVWYKFIPTATSLTVSLTAIGTNLSSSGAMIQLFLGNVCGTLLSVACGTTTLTSAVTNGSTYYIRVYSFGTGSIGGTASGSTFSITATAVTPPQTDFQGGRMKEIFKQTILSAANLLNDPWEVTYGPDGNLWVNEAKGYKTYKIDPVTGVKTTVLDISQGASGYLTPAEHTAFNVQFASNFSPWPQGGYAGLALHPNFLSATNPKNYVYISYVHHFVSNTDPNGIFFINRIVRFRYNTTTSKLDSAVSLCDTLPGSSDHNSQRMIIAPVGGTYYLFYGAGDMGAGQFGNKNRVIKAQNEAAYEGKILRFNLEDDGDPGTLDKWVPNDNPFNAGVVQSAVWSTGIRNNQGFAYDTATGILYGSSHGPYSDDEINIIQQAKNYGHPLVIGYAADGNYNTSTAGAPNTTSSCPLITDEAAAAAAITNYKDPLFSAYAPSQAVLHNIWLTNPSNGGWPSEGWSGLDIYKNIIIPGWKNSLIPCSLKWGRVLRLKLDQAGTSVLPTSGADTVSYFGSTNRYRDVAFAPNGKDMFVIMDKSSTTSGPSAGNPIVPACGGCLVKYTFLGYADASGKSSIPTAIDVTDGTVNTSNTGSTVTIDATNSNYWVPLTGPDGNIMAEIYANGNTLGNVTSCFYKNSGSIRIKGGTRYLDRNITISPQFQPGSPVKIRLYISKAEFDALDADPLSGITAIGDLKILKNQDACGNAAVAATTLITPTYAEAHGTNGYVLQADISSFSSFYFSSVNFTLPLDLITFTGSLQNNGTSLLKWKTENERNVSHFEVQRSSDGINFNAIGVVTANGNSTSGNTFAYSLVDDNIANQPVTVFYYRLKIVDQNGSARYSNVITISLNDIVGYVSVSPNPVISEVMVNLTAAADGGMQWKLIDITGRVLMQNIEYVKKGSGNTFPIDMRKLSSGSYYLKITGDGFNQKVQLQKL